MLVGRAGSCHGRARRVIRFGCQVNRVESVSDDVVSEVKSIGVESLFFVTTGAGLGLYIVIIITPFLGKVVLRSAILDKYLYNNPEMTLDWKQRSKIVKGVVGGTFLSRDIHEFSDSQFGHVFAFEETRAMAIANLGCDRYDLEEVEMVLKLGLLCSHSDPRARPSMRLVLQYLRGDMSLPELTPLDLSAGNGMNLGGREGFSGIGMSYSSSVFNGFTGVSSITDSLLLVGAILTTVVVLSLTVYTFWAAKRGYDFNFLGPFLFGALIVLIVFAMIQLQVRNLHLAHYPIEYAILTTVVVLSLTVYTFWAAKRGYDFNFLGPFLFGALIVLIVFAMIQVTPLIPNSMP
ncbi:hypothetical protein DY000_02052406 [Brassica cretica]|uniref:Uncharacterized protein n=1 Tax=Brassica cretica TaxID=69181 RepID=A0ABQ7ADT3_BRACR|nr:hypothetical protein DY000_02052406 [Brassica cretica]